MEPFVGYIITGIISLAVGYLLKYVEPKSKIVYWNSHTTFFSVPRPPNPDIVLVVHSITIKNTGRRRAETIEIAHDARPDYFKLEPPFKYEEDYTPTKEHLIRLPYLAPKDYFSIEFLSYRTKDPVFLYVRSRDGDATPVEMQPQRQYPLWVQILGGFFVYVGLGFTIYWIGRAVLYLSQNF